MDRPEYITCIAKNESRYAWCGKPTKGVFVFVSIDHAANNGENKGRLVACPECLDAIIPALRNGHSQD